MVGHQLQPGGEAQHITGQGDTTVTPFPVLGGVWQQMHHGSSRELPGGHQESHCIAPSGQYNVVQSDTTCIEASEAGLPQQAE